MTGRSNDSQVSGMIRINTPFRLIEQRLLLARRLLEQTDLSIDDIVRRCGFGSPATLRLHFRRSLGTNPHANRDAFGRRHQ